ncbi:MAG TPA: hypothetical protein VJJ21_00585 [Candidatus Nanoarchaeia archaeon]|nr:hypothetical protein [Candidatus Nanoarchaeia archaeon]
MKKGEWSLTTIAAFILVLVVLVLLVIAFRDKFAALMGSFGDLIKSANESAGDEIVKNAINVPTK